MDNKPLPQRYNKSTAKKYMLDTIPYRVTKKSVKDKYMNTDLSRVWDDMDSALKLLLVSVANTPVEMMAISLANIVRDKLTKRLLKITQQENN